MLDKSLIYKDIVMCLPFEDLEDLNSYKIKMREFQFSIILKM